MAKKVQFTTNQPSATTDYLAADNTWKTIPGGGGGATWGSITGTLSTQTDLQTALNAKENTITGAASTITTSNLTGSRALVSNGGGKVDVSAVTTTELGYLSGVTSDIQTQLNAKQGTLTLTTTGTSGAATLGSGILNIPQYASVGSGAFMLYSSVQSATSITAGATVYGGFINGAYQTLANEYLRLIVMPKNSVVSNFTVYALAQPATGSSVYTVRKNSVDTALVITIPAGSAAGFHTNTLTTVSFNALDYISVKVVNNASSLVQPVCLSIICTI